MKKIISIGLFLFTLCFSCFAFAELKIGVIDMNQILQKSPLMISLNNDLIKKFQGRQDELIKAQKELQDEINQLNLKAATMNAVGLTSLQNKIISDKANVQILDTTLQRDLAIAKDEAMKKFTNKFTEVVNKIAKEGNYDLIQQSNGIAYLNPKLNVTQQVIDQLK